MGSDAPKPRRFAKACDSCYRRKVKCYWSAPACPDCIKRGEACTFTKSKKKSELRRRSSEAGIQRRPMHEARHITPTIPVSRLHLPSNHEHSRDHAATDTVIAAQTFDSTNDQPSSLRHTASFQNPDVSMIRSRVDRYFEDSNQVFPIYHHATFMARFTEPRDDDYVSEPAWELCLECIKLSAQLQELSTCSEASQSQTEERFLERTLPLAHFLVTGAPSLLALQALLHLAVCMSCMAEYRNRGRWSRLLVAAIQMAFELKLHILDSLGNLSTMERLERIRVFWCLYIEDREHSLRTGRPLLIDDEEKMVLEPKLMSDDHVGLVLISFEGVSPINVFAARQRLAVIIGRLRKQLLTFQAQFKPAEQRFRSKILLREALTDWRGRWFDTDMADQFSSILPPGQAFQVTQVRSSFVLCLSKLELS
ncbi:hypothetical protein K431DRAFT_343957 [Polychaeton citri CBS 116435]|uniref:Zn(2)-C6 fungal-type domain-containing protein n=1 Tax=Polychaeton citri CBS 116435 TaxID=1314669 RepID=A0A9P4UTD5_9PEZI|nr:hypothetical protein K431DRAFT_343957 [Polychaeton citri CBS 116435]